MSTARKARALPCLHEPGTLVQTAGRKRILGNPEQDVTLSMDRRPIADGINERHSNAASACSGINPQAAEPTCTGVIGIKKSIDDTNNRSVEVSDKRRLFRWRRHAGRQ